MNDIIGFPSVARDVKNIKYFRLFSIDSRYYDISSHEIDKERERERERENK